MNAWNQLIFCTKIISQNFFQKNSNRYLNNKMRIFHKINQAQLNTKTNQVYTCPLNTEPQMQVRKGGHSWDNRWVPEEHPLPAGVGQQAEPGVVRTGLPGVHQTSGTLHEMHTTLRKVEPTLKRQPQQQQQQYLRSQPIVTKIVNTSGLLSTRTDTQWQQQ